MRVAGMLYHTKAPSNWKSRSGKKDCC